MELFNVFHERGRGVECRRRGLLGVGERASETEDTRKHGELALPNCRASLVNHRPADGE